MKANIIVIGVIQNIAGQYYMQKRSNQLKHPELEGMWEFPGGKVDETDTSFEEAVLREIKEETGCSCYVSHSLFIGLLTPQECKWLDIKEAVIFYKCRILSGIPGGGESANKEWRWFFKDEIKTLKTLPHVLAAVNWSEIYQAGLV
jgi:mutator protein MutT